ncbi:peptidase M4 family protein [Mangrovactinospora gilvigrisea]|uniref:Neutral metalloproteinase n=1 Tax=Mangrovactinospora gilvigrisea TaxID=1428644 RepID=A0A1J7BRX1_9ACTN|nr:M4 family metallopeptidase [Mangrovactinospora gilvigrisea]OIV36201.1 peptidase M4 family protein [Mangrovactinospora gilvigrisea]
MTESTSPTFCTIVPPHILERLAVHTEETAAIAAAARTTLEHDAMRRTRRTLALPAAPGTPSDTPDRTIYTADHRQVEPGKKVRGEGDPAVADQSADRAYTGLGATFEFYLKVFARHSIDDAGLPLDATVHYGRNYDNAFWDGKQMIFGDGDGTIFLDFTIPLDVIGHELTHGVTQYSAGLDYQDQSGALNESVSDVFGSLIKQFSLGQSTAQADWLIGAGLLAPSVHGEALRSMKAPGTAYDDPRLGKDPQPATMDGYVTTTSDSGGVHINSGIPNHAFYLVAAALGGNAWDKAGPIWYRTLTGGGLAHDVDFAGFATATLAAAQALYGAGPERDAVAAAWTQVGVPAK